MITREQFQLQIDRLSDTFGEKHFPDQRTHMMWDAAEGLPYASVISIVDSFIRSSKYAPLPSDFIEAVREMAPTSKKYKLGDLKPLEIANCPDCLDGGFIYLDRKETFEEWAKWHSGCAPCHCVRGRDLIEAGKRRPKEPIDFGPQFNDRWRLSYDVRQMDINKNDKGTE